MTHCEKWEDWIAKLQAHIDVHGHARVPRAHKTADGFNLGRFVGNTREACKNYQFDAEGVGKKSPKAGTLAPGQVSQLDSMGFVWKTVSGRQPEKRED